MHPLLAAAPILLAIILLAFRRGPVDSACAALASAVAVAVLTHTLPAEAFTFGAGYAVLVLEVLLILLFGMCLARMLEASGAIHTIAAALERAVPTPLAGTALVVFAVLPFAESVTGFGIGVTVGVPILRALGHTPPRSALLGLLGLIAVPWGALGPGTAVAAQLAGLSLTEVGVMSGLFNVVPIALTAVVVLVVCRAQGVRHLVMPTLVGAVSLAGGILLTNRLLGTPLAGVLGALLSMAALFGWFRLSSARVHRTHEDSVRATSSASTGRPRGRSTASLSVALFPYALLTAGLLAAQLLHVAVPTGLTEALAWPPVWLAVASIAAFCVLPTRDSVRQSIPGSLRSWVPVGVSTAGFMLMGWIMSVTGMSTAIGQSTAFAGVALGPILMSVGAVLTGSNAGANAMMAPTVTSVANAAGAPVLWAIGASNAAGSFAALATPPRVVMAYELAAGSSANPRHAAWVARTALGIVSGGAILLAATLSLAVALT